MRQRRDSRTSPFSVLLAMFACECQKRIQREERGNGCVTRRDGAAIGCDAMSMKTDATILKTGYHVVPSTFLFRL
ncbi:uncharacterized protein G2W53_013085 [Senna tora]|uniref:Uncharacterized protein n=1 Tax=Senna tora TaxID=362788 RepID=A0A834WQB4_9FABA|nr:uncharacterized protein G2W53_013085 [Senna tora]